MNIFLRMRHGLGDNAQFTIVLRHLRKYRPSWTIDLEVGDGKESYFDGMVANLFRRRIDRYDPRWYDDIMDVRWPVPRVCSDQVPSTKPTRFLQEMMGIEPDPELYRGYEVTITPRENDLAAEYVATLPDRPFVLIHYVAKTLKRKKSLDHSHVATLCLRLLRADLTPVILDWKGETTLPDGRHIFNPGAGNPIWNGRKLATAGSVAALVQRAKLYVGIDSGPLHTAGATTTPTVGVWTRHHPVNFYDLCPNVTHLVPRGGEQFIKGDRKDLGRKYFEANYGHRYYSDLNQELQRIVGDV